MLSGNLKRISAEIRAGGSRSSLALGRSAAAISNGKPNYNEENLNNPKLVAPKNKKKLKVNSEEGTYFTTIIKSQAEPSPDCTNVTTVNETTNLSVGETLGKMYQYRQFPKSSKRRGGNTSTSSSRATDKNQ